MKRWFLFLFLSISILSGCGLSKEFEGPAKDLLQTVSQSMKDSATFELTKEYLKVTFFLEEETNQIRYTATFDKEVFALKNHMKISYKNSTVEEIYKLFYPELYTGVAAVDILNFIHFSFPEMSNAEIGDTVPVIWEIQEDMIKEYFHVYYDIPKLEYTIIIQDK